jgi:seryl-tRNA synthetase
MQCNQCQQENPEGNTFCGHCGARLSASNIVAETVKEIQKEAHLVEVQTVEAIQEKAISWAKVQIFFLGAAVAILQASLIIWGIMGFNDARKEIDKKMQEFVKNSEDSIKKVNKYSEDAIKSAQELKQRSDDLSTNIKQEHHNLEILHAEIKQTEDIVIRGEIKNLENDLKRSIAEAREIRTKFGKEFKESITEAKSAKTQAENNRRSIEKVQNSLFDIFIHFDGNMEHKNKIISEIIVNLNGEGFPISRKNIAQVGVNTTEILYYSETAKAKALFLAKLLQETYPDIYPDIPTRSPTNDAQNPKEILIKLRMP